MAEEKEERKRKRQNSEQFEACNKRSRENATGSDIGHAGNSRNEKMSQHAADQTVDDPCIYDDSLLEDSQFYLQNEDCNGKVEADDSLLGEQTPHERGKRQQKKLRVVVCGEEREGGRGGARVEMREIPLPALSWVDRTELSLLMCFKEDVLDRDRDAHMFHKHPTLTPRMRSILLDWLMEVCDVYKLRRVTYYLAIDYVDRYLSRVEELPKNQLQLLGITCLFVAAKVEEVYPPKLAELAYVTDGACSDQDMLLKELAVLQVLNWDITPLTVSGWLNLYLQILYNTADVRDCGAAGHRPAALNDDFVFPQFSAFCFVRASQLVDLCSLDDRMLHFQYSIIAAAALYFIFNREKALFVSGFTWDHIKGCVSWMAPFYSVISKQPLFSALEGPKDRPRGNSGLKKTNPNILVNEAHSIQTHMISLKMLEDVYKLSSEYCDSESAEESSEQKSNSAQSSDNEESLLDIDAQLQGAKQPSCDEYSHKSPSLNNNLLHSKTTLDHPPSL